MTKGDHSVGPISVNTTASLLHHVFRLCFRLLTSDRKHKIQNCLRFQTDLCIKWLRNSRLFSNCDNLQSYNTLGLSLCQILFRIFHSLREIQENNWLLNQLKWKSFVLIYRIYTLKTPIDLPKSIFCLIDAFKSSNPLISIHEHIFSNTKGRLNTITGTKFRTSY